MAVDSQLGRRMRSEWDRRVQHDYRYWMSDGVASDEAMWLSGSRDLEHILKDLDPAQLRQMVALELGCGVGRLLRPSAKIFKEVIGLDVSHEALVRARSLLSDLDNVTLVQGNGLDLQGVVDQGVDLAFSFAALGSMPVKVVARYIIELSRILKSGGHARLQLYLGKEQQTFEEDTIVLRAFSWERFSQAMQLAGFSVEHREELILDFDVSDHDAGLVAELVFLRKRSAPLVEAEVLAQVLMPSGEQRAGERWLGSETEYLMAVSRAKQHLDSGKPSEALRALEFAVAHYAHAEQEIHELLEMLRNSSPSPADGSGTAAPAQSNGSYKSGGMSASAPVKSCFDRNMEIVRRRFPEVGALLDSSPLSSDIEVTGVGTGTPIVRYRGAPLIHPEKPQRAAESWVRQLLTSPRAAAASELIVVGFAAGYQLAELGRATDKVLHVIEPSLDVLRGVLEHCDMRPVLERIQSLVVDSGDNVTRMVRPLDRASCEIAIIPQSQLLGAETVKKIRAILLSERAFRELRPSFGVVGPMYGGSLPIASYTVNALRALNQRLVVHDLSPFFKSFTQLGTMVQERGRREKLETGYVELLSDMVLERVAEHPVDILICLAQAPLSPRALTELRARGIITVMWFVEDYQRFHTWKLLAPYFDYMFVIQKGEAIRAIKAAGAGSAIYLPVGCDPYVHRPLDLSREEHTRFGSAISFVGAGYNNRRHVFAHLARRDFKIWGTEWPSCAPFDKLVQDAGRRIDPSDYVKVFNASQVNVNLHSSAERDGVEPYGDFVNPRTFELAACEAFQLVDEREYLAENFTPGEEVATFRDTHELEEKIDYYLAHPAERARIARNGRSRALQDHTYAARLRTMLEQIYADRFEQLRDRLHGSSWSRTLREAERHPVLKERFEQVFQRGGEPKLDSLVDDIQAGRGSLSEAEQKLLFLHHIRSQISYVKALRNEKD